MKRIFMVMIMGLLSTSTFAARIDTANVTVSSSFAPTGGVRYDAKQSKDGKLSTCWVEGDEGSGLGAWMQLDLGGEHAVDTLKIWAGMWYSYDYWTRANRPKTIEFKFSDGSVETHEMTDKMVVQVVKLNKVHKTSTVRMKIKAVYNGNTWFDTAISEVQVFDMSAEKNVAISTYRSSSELPEDGDGNYQAKNVNDGINDSMWCEGNKEGDGTGEWLEFDFKGQHKVGSMTLVNGIGSTMMIWMKGNRATEAQLDFGDGSSEKVMVKNSYQPQTITFPSRMTSSVKVTFTKVMKGKEYNDLCVSEAFFSQ